MRSVWLCLALAGCEPAGGIGQTQLPIVSGEVDLEDAAVVAVYLAWDGGEDRLCTGTVVSPRVVLTAGHCLVDAGSASRFDVGFGTDVRDAPEYDPVTWVAAVDHTIDPGLSFDDPRGGHDVGLVLLAEPSAVPAMPMSLSPPPDGASVRAVGYGRTARDLTDAGVKREVMAPVTRIESLLFFFGDAVSNTCLGDSGGPTFLDVDGTEVVVGISSFGDSQCADTTGATRVDEFLFDFIYPWIGDHDPDAPAPPPRPPEMGGGGGCSVAGGGAPGLSALGALGLLAALVTVLEKVRRLLRPA